MTSRRTTFRTRSLATATSVALSALTLGAGVSGAAPAASYPVAGAIRDTYLRYGGAPVMGAPLNAERAVTTSASAGYPAWRQDFQYRTILASPAPGVGGHTVHRTGGIGPVYLSRYAALDLPTSEQYATTRSAWRQNFQRSTIYYSAKSGTQRVEGAIRDYYNGFGAEYSAIGLPIGPIFGTATGWSQRFMHGQINVSRTGARGITWYAGYQAASRPTVRSDVALSWRPGCPVGPSSLVTLDLNYWDFNHVQRRGRMVVHRNVVKDVVTAFNVAYDTRFPIAKMVDPSAYGNDDYRSMAANNTYAFSCRPVTGSNPPRVSPHSYGTSVDVNPVQNPYRQDNGVWAPSAAYANRSIRRPGMLFLDTPVTRTFNSYGWGWFYSFDTQHFQKGERNR